MRRARVRLGSARRCGRGPTAPPLRSMMHDACACFALLSIGVGPNPPQAWAVVDRIDCTSIDWRERSNRWGRWSWWSWPAKRPSATMLLHHERPACLRSPAAHRTVCASQRKRRRGAPGRQASLGRGPTSSHRSGYPRLLVRSLTPPLKSFPPPPINTGQANPASSRRRSHVARREGLGRLRGRRGAPRAR